MPPFDFAPYIGPAMGILGGLFGGGRAGAGAKPRAGKRGNGDADLNNQLSRGNLNRPGKLGKDFPPPRNTNAPVTQWLEQVPAKV